MIAPYLLLLLLPLAWAGARAIAPAAERVAIVGIWIILVLFLGLRHQTGGDWDNYLLLFQRTHVTSFLVALSLSDPGYMLVDYGVSRLGLGLGFVNLFCTAIFAAGLLRFAASQPAPPLALLVAMPVLVLLGAMGATRQSVAAGLLMWAIADHGRGRRAAASLMLVAAVLFHWSAAALLPLIPLILIRKTVSPRAILATGVALAVAIVLVSVAVPSASYFEYAQEASGALVRVGLSGSALGGLVWLWRRNPAPSPDAISAAYLGLVTLISLALLLVSWTAADRMAYYTVPLQIYVATRIVTGFGTGRVRAAAQVALSLPFAALFIAWLTLSSYRHCYLPYRSYLSQPHLLLRGDSPEQFRMTCVRRAYDV